MRARAARTARACALVVVVVVAVAGVMMGLFSGSRPDNLGVRDGRLAPCKPTPNCVSSQTDADKDSGHYIAPIRIAGSARDARARLRRVVQEAARAKVIADNEIYLYAEFTSRFMGFVDDVEFLLDEKTGLIHVRSASRLGASDFGVNRSRVESVRNRLAAEAK